MKKLYIIAGFILAGATSAAASSELIIYHAGSLSLPFAKIEKQFEAAHPDIDIKRKAGGSTKLARLISEKGEYADIMASADYVVIDKNLIPKYAASNIRFASNRLVLCYTDNSRFAAKISQKNWPEILLSKDVSWGHSDPNLDPCGYRSLMVMQLAEKARKQPGLYQNLIASRPADNVKAKATQLISLLKKGDLDYGWEYRSVAEQHGLRYIELDEKINLGNRELNDFYRQAKVTVTGKKKGATITRTGKSITYGITLLKKSNNPQAATLFMEYLLNPKGGMKILNDMGQPTISPARVATSQMQDALPLSLQKNVEIK